MSIMLEIRFDKLLNLESTQVVAFILVNEACYKQKINQSLKVGLLKCCIQKSKVHPVFRSLICQNLTLVKIVCFALVINPVDPSNSSMVNMAKTNVTWATADSGQL